MYLASKRELAMKTLVNKVRKAFDTSKKILTRAELTGLLREKLLGFI